MARLKFRLQWTGSGGPAAVGPQLISAYISGATGTPQTRAYLASGGPSAYVAYPLSLTGIPDGLYNVDYKDIGITDVRLGVVDLEPYATGCWVGGTYVNPTWQFSRFETYVEIRGIVSAGSGTTEVSLNNVNWKTLISDGFGLAASYTNAELATLGYVNSIPTIYIRRTYLTNVKSVSTVTSSAFPGQVGKAQFAVPSGVTPYIVGNVIRLVNMPGYGINATIAAIPGPNDIIINVPYSSPVSGGSFGIQAAPCASIIATDAFIGEISVAPFVASEVHTNETATDANDGTITLTLSAGSGSFGFAWADGPTTQNRSGLSAGLYSVTITDNVTGQEATINVTITEPAVVPIPNGTYLDIPKQQSLRFVREATIDNCNTFQNFDNTLFCKMVFNGIQIKTPFYQKVCKCDILTIQIHSNFSSHQVELMSQVTGLQVKNFNNIELKQQLTGIVSSFDGFITDRAGSDPAGTSRVYFNTSTIPVPVSNGDVFQVINNGDGYDGTYTIVGISADVLLGAPYLLITLVYDAGTPTSAMRAVFTENVLNFDIYESILNFQDVAPGLYFARVRGVNADNSFTQFVSEPIDLRSTHLNTHLIEARNFDNTDDVVFTTGITVKIRLESKLHKTTPGRQGENYRESNGNPVKLGNKPQRKFKMDWFNQPFYRHELLNSMLGWDQLIINKVEYFCEEGPAEPANRDFFLLSNGNALIEQRNWFQQYNGDDLGGVDPGYILTQYGYIQRT